MSKRLNQVVAVVAAQKAETEKALTAAYHAFQKGELFSGMSRTYTPRNAEDTDGKPPERKNPQQSVRDLYTAIEPVLVKTWNSTATQDWANCSARADVRVGDLTVLAGVPVPHLLYLEHKLADLKAFVEKMPVRDPAETWTFDENVNAHATPTVRKESTKKVNRPIVLYDATDKHPAQTQLVVEDQVVGYWDERKFSTAVSARERDVMLGQIAKLAEAVKVAREEANNIPTEGKEVAAPILNFVFGGVLK